MIRKTTSVIFLTLFACEILADKLIPIFHGRAKLNLMLHNKVHCLKLNNNLKRELIIGHCDETPNEFFMNGPYSGKIYISDTECLKNENNRIVISDRECTKFLLKTTSIEIFEHPDLDFFKLLGDIPEELQDQLKFDETFVPPPDIEYIEYIKRTESTYETVLKMRTIPCQEVQLKVRKSLETPDEETFDLEQITEKNTLNIGEYGTTDPIYLRFVKEDKYSSYFRPSILCGEKRLESCKCQRPLFTHEDFCLECLPGDTEKFGTTCDRCTGRNIYDQDIGACVPCTGNRIPNSDKNECVPCGVNQIINEDKTECVTCVDKLVPNSEKTLCITCGINEKPDTDNSKCVCNERSYKRGNDCVVCRDDQILNRDKPGCKTCPDNHIIDKENSRCLPCGKNEIPNEQKTKCAICGYNLVPNQAKTSCVRCPEDSIPNEDRSECVTCGVNKVAHRDMSMCICNEMTYESGTDCLFCRDGKVPKRDKSGCETCSGKYVLNDRKTKCVLCTNRKVPNSDNTACVCDENAYIYYGNCIPCRENKVPDDAKKSCIECPVNSKAINGKCECLEGFTKVEKECKPTTILPIEKVCPMFSTLNKITNKCECLQGYYISSKICVSVQAKEKSFFDKHLWIFILLAALILLIIGGISLYYILKVRVRNQRQDSSSKSVIAIDLNADKKD